MLHFYLHTYNFEEKLNCNKAKLKTAFELLLTIWHVSDTIKSHRMAKMCFHTVANTTDYQKAFHISLLFLPFSLVQILEKKSMYLISNTCRMALQHSSGHGGLSFSLITPLTTRQWIQTQRPTQQTTWRGKRIRIPESNKSGLDCPPLDFLLH